MSVQGIVWLIVLLKPLAGAPATCILLQFQTLQHFWVTCAARNIVPGAFHP